MIPYIMGCTISTTFAVVGYIVGGLLGEVIAVVVSWPFAFLVGFGYAAWRDH